MNNFLFILFTMSMRTVLIIGFIIFIKKALSFFFTPNTQYYIWFLILISLCIYKGPESNFSLYNVPAILDVSYESDANYIRNENYKLPEIEVSSVNYKSTELVTEKLDFSSVTTYFKTVLSMESKSGKIFFSVWLFVFVFLLCNVIIKGMKFQKNLKKEVQVLNKESVLQRCQQILGVKNKVVIVSTNEVSTPSVFGLFSYKILLPEYILLKFDDENLEYILLHELSHIKRKDLIINWIIIIFQLIYWFNPIIWIGFSKMKNDMEIACDAYVLKHIDKKKHLSYGRVLINLIEYFSNRKRGFIVTNIIGNKTEITRRIVMIKKYKKNSKVVSLIGILLIVLVGCTAMNAPKTNDVTPKENMEESSTELDEKIITTSDIKDEGYDYLIGKDYSYLFNEMNTPYVRTYYIDNENLEDRDSFPNESIYPIDSDEESSALYVYIEDNIIVSHKIDEFVGSPNEQKKSSRYVMSVYSYTPGIDIDQKDFVSIEEDPELVELKEEYLNKSLFEFRDKFDLIHGFTEVVDKETNLNLSIYPVVSKESASSYLALYIISENNTILNMKVDKSDLELKTLPEQFALPLSKN